MGAHSQLEGATGRGLAPTAVRQGLTYCWGAGAGLCVDAQPWLVPLAPSRGDREQQEGKCDGGERGRTLHTGLPQMSRVAHLGGGKGEGERVRMRARRRRARRDVSALTAHNREGEQPMHMHLKPWGTEGSVRPSIPSKSSPMDVLPMLVLLP